MTNDDAGRICPLRYRYGAEAIARAPEKSVDALYVVGGLYGNRAALDAVEAMAQCDAGAPVLCFNGDFNWFDIDDASFADVNLRVLAHDATCGNVEAEFGAASDDAGCGCAYPESVDAGVVERSNRIHAMLKRTAARHPALLDRIAALPMVARYRVGGRGGRGGHDGHNGHDGCRVGIVHGDADALAGWGFDASALDDNTTVPWQRDVFARADVDVFASTHTCVAAMRRVDLGHGRSGWVANNGAAGMPNFAGETAGLLTRIATTRSPLPVVHEIEVAGCFVALLPIDYDAQRFRAEFDAQWPPGSPAAISYGDRIVNGPRQTRSHALPRVEAHPAPCEGSRALA